MMKPGYWLLRFLAAQGYNLLGGVKVHGRENFIEHGGAIVAANHASYLDPPLLGVVAREELHYLARKSLFDEKPICWALPFLNLIPVDPTGRDMAAVKKIIQFVKAGERVVLFPEGTRTPDGNLQPAEPGIGLIIAKTLVPVVPVRIFGTWEAFPKGAKKIRRAPIHVVIGEPIHFTKEDVGAGGREDYQRISERIMASIAKLSLPTGKA